MIGCPLFFNEACMKMKKWVFSALLFSILLQNSIVNADGSVKKDMHEETGTIVSEQDSVLDKINAYQYFINACTAYEFARMETDAGKRSQFYADAVRNISKIVATDIENGEAFLLASQIYRAKGGASYAERYLKQADGIFYHAAQTNPQNISANLDYAVFCFATSLPSSPDQEKRALVYADKTIQLIEAQRKLPAVEPNNSNLRYEALAYLVKGDHILCEKLLAAAADYNKQKGEDPDVDENNISGSVYNRKHTTANIFYHSLFRDTVMKQIWLWPVAAKNLAKEFLLYYLTDLSRNEE